MRICEQPRNQAQRTGYTNLLSHLTSKHPIHGDEYAEFQRRNMASLQVLGFVDEVTTHMYGWLRLIVKRNLPLSEVENQLTRQLVRMKSTSAETLKIYMYRVAGRVGNTIAKEMGEFFGVMFDRWSSGTRYFVAVFVVYYGPAACSCGRGAAPRLSDHRRILVLDDKMEELQSVCEKVQQHKRTLGKVRALFDACRAKYPVMEEYLKPTA
ncbi:Cellobiose dehydrogenase [Phytophthora cinnamomi]|uniref:Cellobiose dehydrogenase n=1 Tax=Phytophthora cinnamomi TaxID=4785 RepID=UPI0035595A1D|nr:Cellobiose dehydrogenase [Phytophthora cinnamomi]